MNKIINKIKLRDITNKHHSFNEKVCFRISEMIRKGGAKCKNVVLDQEDLVEYADQHPYDYKLVKGTNAMYIEFEKVTIPPSINCLGHHLFSDCHSLTSIEFHNQMLSLDKRCLEHCVNLQSIIIPPTVTYIGNSVFSQCSQLTKCVLPPIKVLPKGLFYNCGFVEFEIPKGVTKIEKDCFSECHSLTKIVIPDSVVSIGKRAFENCFNLKEIVLNSSMIAFAEGCFAKTQIPQNNSLIPSYAFEMKKEFN